MMFRNRQYSRTTVYIAIAIGVLVLGFLSYGLTRAITQSSLALVTGLMLLVGNLPEVVRTLQRREVGLAMLNTLIGIALVSFFMVKMLGFLFYIPLLVALLLAIPLTLNRVAIARTYIGLLKTFVFQLRRLIRLPNSYTQR